MLNKYIQCNIWRLAARYDIYIYIYIYVIRRLKINIPNSFFSNTACEYPSVVWFPSKNMMLSTHSFFYRTQAFRINLMCFSCLKSGFSWLPSLDLLLTISLLMEFVSHPTIRSENKVYPNIFTPSSLRNGPRWFPSCTVPKPGVLISTSVSTS